MVTELIPFQLSFEPVIIAGIGLWALTLYLSFYRLSQWLVEQISQGFSLVERSTYASEKEFEKARPAWEVWNTFWASIFSILPFLVIGGLCYYGLVVSLGQSWAVSTGFIACVGSGVYELGRRNGQSSP